MSVQVDELEAEVRYRVTFEQSFEGTLRSVDSCRGVLTAVFDTGPFAAQPYEVLREFPLDSISVERLP